MLIFLDFDGVLRRAGAPRQWFFEEALLEAFGTAVRWIPGAAIVISSSWREGADLSDLRKLFPRDIAEKVVGMTPFVEGGRYREILAYVEKAGAGGRWLAVDDDPYSYPTDAPLVLVDPLKGFGTEDAEKLVRLALERSLPSV